eukprot:349961-Prymnesium_polylepis.1
MDTRGRVSRERARKSRACGVLSSLSRRRAACACSMTPGCAESRLALRFEKCSASETILTP